MDNRQSLVCPIRCSLAFVLSYRTLEGIVNMKDLVFIEGPEGLKRLLVFTIGDKKINKILLFDLEIGCTTIECLQRPMTPCLKTLD